MTTQAVETARSPLRLPPAWPGGELWKPVRWGGARQRDRDKIARRKMTK